MDDKYKVIPFAEVAVGQEFEDSHNMGEPNLTFTDDPFIKLNESSFKTAARSYIYLDVVFPGGCLVRIADCAPVLDTCTWTHKEHAWESTCGVSYAFTEEQDSLELNGFIFCHKCGEKIVEAK
jgi:hypothetical protein